MPRPVRCARCAPNARVVRVVGRCRSTRRKPCSSKPATFQKSPAFAEFRRRRQVVEHRLARLVQLGIRQARYFGRTKTLFQMCLAAAVANLTLLAATATASSAPDGALPNWSLDLLGVILTLSSLLCTVGLAAFLTGQSLHPDCSLSTFRRQMPPSRPRS